MGALGHEEGVLANEGGTGAPGWTSLWGMEHGGVLGNRRGHWDVEAVGNGRHRDMEGHWGLACMWMWGCPRA